VENGTEKPISPQQWRFIGRVAWLSDGSGLIMAALESPAQFNGQLWYLSYPSGETRRITNDLNDYGDVSLTADSSTLVTVQSDEVSNVWLVPDGDARRAKQLTFGARQCCGLSWTPDDKNIVYASRAGGNEDIWITEPTGSNHKQLTLDA